MMSLSRHGPVLLTIMTKRQKALYIMSAIVLTTGLVASGVIYFTAREQDETGYQVIGGFIYPNATESSKRYIHDLERFGGRAAVLSDKFMRWFSSLWQGESLAYTVGVISIIVSACLYFAARYGSRLHLDAEQKTEHNH